MLDLQALLMPTCDADISWPEWRMPHMAALPPWDIHAELDMDAVGGAQVAKARLRLQCSLCGQCYGSCVQCAGSRTCCTAFHPLCARAAGLRMESVEAEASGEDEAEAELLWRRQRSREDAENCDANITQEAAGMATEAHTPHRGMARTAEDLVL